VAKDKDGIYGVLERAGINTGVKKMLCPHCEHKSITAREDWGFAQCWHCCAKWSVKGDARSEYRDWGAYVVGEIGRLAQDTIVSHKDCERCSRVENYMWHRNLTPDWDWLIEHDLGELVGIATHLPAIAKRAEQLFDEWLKEKKAEQAKLEQLRKGLTGKDKKRLNNKLSTIDFETQLEQDAKHHLLEEIFPRLAEPEWNGSAVYIYRDEHGIPTSLNIRQVATEKEDRKNKKLMRVQPRSERRGLFGVRQARLPLGEGWTPEDKVPALIVVEGEHNQLALCRTAEEWMEGDELHLCVVAMGGKMGADTGTLKEFCKNKDPLVIYDNDAINPETGQPGGFDLVRSINELMYCTVCSTADYDSGRSSAKDLDDLIEELIQDRRKFDYSDFLDMIGERSLARMNIKTVADSVAAVLMDKSIEVNSKIISVSSIITEDAAKRWKLRRVGNNPVLIDSNTHFGDLIRCTPDDANFGKRMKGYGIAERRWLAAVAEAFREKVSIFPRSVIHSEAFYDPERQWLYKNVYDGTMIVIWIEGEGPSAHPVIDRVAVGTDDVFFWRFAQNSNDHAAALQPWLATRDDIDKQIHLEKGGGMRLKSDSLIKKHIWDGVKYESNMTHYQQLLQCWSLFNSFATNFKSKPAIALQGPPGSTKTALMQRLGFMMQGENFNVIQQPTSGEDLAIKINKLTLAAFDEWDTTDAKIENLLNAILTGAPFAKRALYTDEDKHTILCNAAIMMTRNSDPMRAAGSFRRIICVPLADRGDTRYRSMTLDIIPELIGVRQDLRLEELRNCAYALLALSQTSPTTTTSYSVADFGSFVMRCAQFEGWAEEAEAMLNQLVSDQSATAIENNALVDLLASMFERTPDLIGKTYTTGFWANCLHVNGVLDYDVAMKSRVNGKYLAWQFRTHTKVFQDRLGMIVKEDKAKGQNVYTFNPPGAKTGNRNGRVGRESEVPDMTECL
jgi:hypothetical protein